MTETDATPGNTPEKPGLSSDVKKRYLLYFALLAIVVIWRFSGTGTTRDEEYVFDDREPLRNVEQIRDGNRLLFIARRIAFGPTPENRKLDSFRKLLAYCRSLGDKGKDLDIPISMLLNNIACYSENDPKEHLRLHEEMLAAYRGKSGFPPYVYVEVGRALVEKAGLVGPGTERVALLNETLELLKDTNISFGIGQMAAARNMMAQDSDDPEEQKKLYDEIIASAGDRVGSPKLLWELGIALTARARMTDDIGKKQELLKQAIQSCSRNRSTLPWALYAARLKVRIGGEEERLALANEVIAKFKDNEWEYAQDTVSAVVDEKLRILKTRPESDEQYVAMIAEIENSRAKALVPKIMLARVETTSDPLKQAALSDELLSKYGGENDEKIRRVVLGTLEKRAGSLNDVAEKTAVLNRLVSLAESDTSGTHDFQMGNALLAIADAAPDKDGKIAAYDRLLDLYKKRGSNDLTYSANRAVEAKARLTGDSRLVATYYRDIASTSGKDGMTSSALRNLARATNDSAGREAVNRELVERFGNTREPGVGMDVVRALNSLARGNDRAGLVPAYERLIKRFDNKEKGGEVAAQAMLGKAEIIDDKDEKVALYDRVIASGNREQRGYGIRDSVDEAVRKKSELLDDPEILTKHYEKAAAGGNARERIRAMTRLADTTADRDERLKVYDGIIATFGGETSSPIRSQVVNAQIERAKLLGSTAEKAAQFREIIDANKDSSEYSIAHSVDEAYDELAKASTGADRLQVLEESVAYSEARGKPFPAAIKLHRMADFLKTPAEKIAVYDRILALPVDDRKYIENQQSRARFKKAELVSDPAEKVKLYDAVIDALGSTLSALDSSMFVAAVVGRAKAANDSEFIKKQAAGLLKGNLDPVAVILASISLAEALPDKEAKLALYDGVIEKYGDSAGEREKHPMLRLRLSRAKLLDDTDAVAGIEKAMNSVMAEDMRGTAGLRRKMSPYRATREAVENAEKPEDKIRHYDAFIARARDSRTIPQAELVEALVERAGITPDKDEAAKIFAEAFERIEKADFGNDGFGRFRFNKKDHLLRKAHDGLVGAAGTVEEKTAIRDAALERYYPRKDATPYFVFSLLMERARSTVDNAEQKKRYEQIIADFGESDDDSVNRMLGFAYRANVRLTDDKAEKDRIYERWIGHLRRTGDKYNIVDALLERAKNIEDAAGRRGAYDAIIAEFAGGDELVQRDLLKVHKAIIGDVPDKTEKIRMYDGLLAGLKASDNDVISVMFDKADILENAAEKIAVYDEILNRFSNSDADFVSHSLARAAMAKARLVEDRDEKLRLYDQVIAMEPRDRWSRGPLMDGMRRQAEREREKLLQPTPVADPE